MLDVHQKLSLSGHLIRTTTLYKLIALCIDKWPVAIARLKTQTSRNLQILQNISKCLCMSGNNINRDEFCNGMKRRIKHPVYSKKFEDHYS
jgi:hypothetical protein